jgi:hypothetical protein
MAILAVTALSWGCSTPPQPEIDAANAAIAKAQADQAAEYAGNAMRDAEAARAALESELNAQQQAWFVYAIAPAQRLHRGRRGS